MVARKQVWLCSGEWWPWRGEVVPCRASTVMESIGALSSSPASFSGFDVWWLAPYFLLGPLGLGVLCMLPPGGGEGMGRVIGHQGLAFIDRHGYGDVGRRRGK